MVSQYCAKIGLGTAQAVSPSKLNVPGEASGRVCLSLEYTDPGRILNLCRSLFEKNSVLIQKKINKYIMTVIPCCNVFQIIRFSRVNLYKVTIIGKNPLQQEIHISHDSPLFRKLKNTEGQAEIFLDEMQPELANEIKLSVAPSNVARLMAYPILHPASGKHLSYVILVNYDQIIDYKRIYYGLINECMRYCIGILVNAVSYDEERIGHERARHFVDKLKDILTNIEDSHKMITEIKKTLVELTNAERSNLLLMNNQGELSTSVVIMGETVGFESKALEVSDRGVTKNAIMSGRLLNCSEPTNEKCSGMHATGLRNQLSCPLKKDSQVIGVIEVYNKKSWHCFTDADEECIKSMSVVLSPLLRHSLQFMKMAKLEERSILVNSLFLSRMPTEYEIHEIENCTAIHEFPKYNGFQFIHLEMANSHVECVITEIFHQLGLLTKFKIPRVVFCKFVLATQKSQANHSYHNWTQSFGVLHFAANLVNSHNLIKDSYLSCLEVFALLLAAMSVGLSHCGVTSAFQVTSGTALGSLFSSPGSLQVKYSLGNLFRIAYMPGCRIWENISSHDFNILKNLLVSLMQVTDLSSEAADYHNIAAPLHDLRKEDPECRLALMKLLLQCSFLSDFTKAFSHLRLVGELLFFEFFRQGDLSRAGNVFDLTPFEPSPETVPALQIEFIEKICLPPFRLLCVIFPNMLDCTKRLEDNLATWTKYKDHFLLGQLEEEEKEEE